MKLQGKTAIVTGGGRDIGSAVAKKLASEGANVAINYFASSAGAEATVAARIVDRTIEAFGGIDVLVNNSGGLVARAKIAEMSLEHWQNVMDVNLTSTFMVTNAVLQHMTSGAIVNLASQAGRDGGGPGAIPYATSKGAMMTMTRGLAKELGPDIRVNALCPGMIDTDFHNIHTPEAGRRGFEAAAPVKRQGHVDDTAKLVLFLACNDSAFMTGTNVDINGGMLFS